MKGFEHSPVMDDGTKPGGTGLRHPEQFLLGLLAGRGITFDPVNFVRADPGAEHWNLVRI
ncbi:MAG: hypothetical protein IPH84_19235 [Bacteroidales bacterium]|nr:hypothetical protein [Bacteroidales bacterium]